MSLPILYSFRRCPYAMRARLAIWFAGIECELREVVLRDKPQSMLEYSAKGTVPVLILDDGTVIDESLDVMLWALAACDDAGWLQPSAESLESMLALIDKNDNEFKSNLDRYKYPDRYANSDPLVHRTQAEQFLSVLDERIALHGYLSDPVPRLSDYALLPFIRQFANHDRTWFDASEYQALRQWLDNMLATPLFQAIMVKYPVWQANDVPTFVPD